MDSCGSLPLPSVKFKSLETEVTPHSSTYTRLDKADIELHSSSPLEKNVTAVKDQSGKATYSSLSVWETDKQQLICNSRKGLAAVIRVFVGW